MAKRKTGANRNSAGKRKPAKRTKTAGNKPKHAFKSQSLSAKPVPPGKSGEFASLCETVIAADREAFKYTLLGEQNTPSIHSQRENALGQLRSVLGLPEGALLLIRKEGNRFVAVDLVSRQRFTAR